jgi:hypothetical protein
MQMLEEMLKRTEELIRDNIKQYREQFQKETMVFSESLKKEYSSIKGIVEKMLDEVADKFEKKITAKERDAREESQKIFSEQFKDISQRLSDLTVKLESLEKLQEKNFEVVQNQMQIIDLKLKDMSEEILSQIEPMIEKYIEKNKKEIRSKILGSFFGK